MSTATEVKAEAAPIEIGDAVLVVDETRRRHIGLVTAVHGAFIPSTDKAAGPGYVPCINVVYVSGDEQRRDPYGRQVDRMSSLQHYSQGPSGMPAPGRFWANL